MLKHAFRLKFKGKDLDARMASRVQSISAVDESKKQGDTISITFDDGEEDLMIPGEGDSVELYLGTPGNLSKIGEYVVDEASIEGPPFVMNVSGKGFNSDSKIKTRKTKNYNTQNAYEILEKIAKQNSLEPKISPEFKESQFPYGFPQCKESDLHYGTRLTSILGGTFKIQEKKLVATKEGHGKTVEGKPLSPVTIERSQIVSIRYGKAKRVSYQSARCIVRNVSTGEKEQVQVGGGDPVLSLSEVYGSKEEAISAARAKLTNAKFASEKVTLTVDGDARLSAERQVTLTGFRRGLDGSWIVDRASHNYSDGTYTTEISLKKPAPKLDMKSSKVPASDSTKYTGPTIDHFLDGVSELDLEAEPKGGKFP